MTEDIKVQTPDASDKAKLVIAALLVAAGIAGYYLLGTQSAWVRWGSVALGIVAGALMVALSGYGAGLKQFAIDARVELRKVVWPTRQETLQTTLVVFVFVAIAGVFFWALDLVLAWATKFLTGQGS